jgi:hypothetical protein
MPTTNGSGIRVRRLEPDAGKLARPVLRGLGEQQRFPGYPVVWSLDILSGRGEDHLLVTAVRLQRRYGLGPLVPRLS